MKKFLLSLLLIASTLPMRAAEYDFLVFTLTNGTTKTVAASNLTFTFNDGNLITSSGHETLATLPLAQLTQMEFANDDSTGIVTISTNTLTTDSTISCYDMKGRLMPSGTSLPKGTYIVKTQKRTIKIYIK